MTNKITTRSLSIIIIAGFTILKLYVMPANLAGFVGEGLYLSLFFNFVLDFVLLLFVLSILNRTNKSVFETTSDIFNKKTARVIMFFYAIFFLLKSFTPILEQKNVVELTFYETQPSLLTFLPYFFIGLYLMIKGLKSFSRCLELSLGLFIVGMTIILALSITHGKYSILIPIMSKTPVQLFSGAFKALLWFGDPIFLLFFAGELKKDGDFNKKIIISYTIYFAITIVTVMVFYSIYGSIAERQYYAIMKMSKYSITLSNIGRFDYLASLLLLMVSVFQISLPLIFASISLNSCFAFKNKFISPFIVFAVEIAFSFLSQNDFFSVVNFTQKYTIWFFIIMTYVIPFILFLLVRRKKYDL